jgi:beta-carotene ketolase (CrtW type)
VSVREGAAAPLNPVWQGFVGVSLAVLVILAWLATHIAGVFLFRFAIDPPLLVPILVALQCWLNVGLFIVAHDAMHGSLAPFRPGINRAFGRLCLMLYAGFSFDRLLPKHFDHHRHSGTALDPDFHADGPTAFWPWFLAFFRRYFGWREFLTLAALLVLYLGIFRVHTENALVFWALPAILSAVQLFYFGTYLPHRHEEEAFSDRHNARSNDFSWLMSLLTCFHFGYHHEHHDNPRVPWWHLPRARGR